MGTLDDLTVAELIESARDEVAGLAALADKFATPEGQVGPSDSDALLIGAYHGSIGARLVVAKIKLEEEAKQAGRSTVAVGERVTARHVREFHKDYGDEGAMFVHGLDGDDEMTAFDILASTFADNSVFERVT
jgi:hypothetical protein